MYSIAPIKYVNSALSFTGWDNARPTPMDEDCDPKLPYGPDRSSRTPSIDPFGGSWGNDAGQPTTNEQSYTGARSGDNGMLVENETGQSGWPSDKSVTQEHRQA